MAEETGESKNSTPAKSGGNSSPPPLFGEEKKPLKKKARKFPKMGRDIPPKEKLVKKPLCVFPPKEFPQPIIWEKYQGVLINPLL